MRSFLLSIGLLLAFTVSVSAADIAGIWQSQTNADGYIHVEIAPCEDKVCGVIAKAFDVNGEPAEFKYLGKTMIWDMIPAANGEFTGGRIFAPDREKTYGGMLKLHGDVLIVRGCALGGLVCKEQKWNRVIQETEGTDNNNTGTIQAGQ
ncbi:MAG: DUF2147 domain-containing protein [Methyloligellaceae bacterium]